MACSKYQYVKSFQASDQILPQSFIMVRIDGKGFTKFCQNHNFKKPNDLRCINLMNYCATQILNTYKQIWLAYGQSDQYSFVFLRDTNFFNRRLQKILTTIVSTFSSLFVFNWCSYFEDVKLKCIPSFDGRIVIYPNIQCLKDYFRWRQVDCHINNLYNMVFWGLVKKKGLQRNEVEKMLKVTNSGDKNEILFKQLGINYNEVDEVYRKGSIICYWDRNSLIREKKKVGGAQNKNVKQIVQEGKEEQKGQKEKMNEQQQINGSQVRGDEKEKGELKGYKQRKEKKKKYKLQVLHIDLIKDSFWENVRMV